MRKLLKYQMLNSYKYFAAAFSVIIIGYIVDYYLFFANGTVYQISSMTNIFAYSILILFSIDSVRKLINKGKGMALYLTPFKKNKIFLSNTLISFIYLILIIIEILLLNIPIGHIPFIDNDFLKVIAPGITAENIITMNIFYLGLSLGLSLAILAIGTLVIVLGQVFFKNNKYKGVIEIIIFFGVFGIYNILMDKGMNFIGLDKTMMIKVNTLSNGGIRGVSLFPMGNSPVFNTEYINTSLVSIYINIGAVVFNFLWSALMIFAYSIIFEKKVDI